MIRAVFQDNRSMYLPRDASMCLVIEIAVVQCERLQDKSRR